MALYHSTSNGPVEVKKHQIMGSVGYTKVGSPTIVDGVASGFSYDNYLTVQQPTSGIVEFVFKIKYVSTGSGQCLYRIVRRGPVEQLLRIESNNKITFTNNIKDLNSATILSDNTNYWLKLIYNPGNSISLSLSTNGTDYTLEDEAVGDVVALSDTEMTIGGYRLDTYMYKNFAGSIDLNETYIKVNGKLWFWQPAPTKYIVKDDKLVFADQGLYLTGPVNYEVVGNPTINDGIASSINYPTNFLQSTQKLPSDLLKSDFEFQLCFTNGSVNPSANQELIRIARSGPGTVAFIYINVYGRLVVYGSYNSQGNLYANDRLALSTSTKYWFKYAQNSGTVTVSYSTDGVNFTTLDTQSGYGYDTVTTAFSRLIFSQSGANGLTFDMNNTYLKINGSLWFYGKNYASKNIAPVPAGYTYGTTTTPSIGYVDMRTQAFTAAPSGATIGRDEQ